MQWNNAAMSFKLTCTLNATFNKSVFIHFTLGKFCSHENFEPVWKFISIKMIHIKSIPVWVSICLKSCEHKKLNEHQGVIFNQNEISYQFQFILHLMWTYSNTFTIIGLIAVSTLKFTNNTRSKNFRDLVFEMKVVT